MKKRASKVLAPEDVEQLLNDWVKLNEDILCLSETAVRQLLATEVAGRRRQQVLTRLYSRFSRMRLRRERRALFEEGKLPC